MPECFLNCFYTYVYHFFLWELFCIYKCEYAIEAEQNLSKVAFIK